MQDLFGGFDNLVRASGWNPVLGASFGATEACPYGGRVVVVEVDVGGC
jgi:hypothetical protein